MPMPGETLVVALLVAGALLFIGRRFWRAVQSTRTTSARGCDAGCGCDTGAARGERDWAERGR